MVSEPTPFRPHGKRLGGVFRPSKIAAPRGHVSGGFRPPRIRFGQDPANRGARDVMALRDLPQAPTMGAIVQDGGTVYLERGTSNVPAFELH